ncbi:protein canopy 4-like isoform X2 [Eurytemora carolleeae]|uniref:protein canopy 4-like isoform X2 n=1 Tax=Eurytemora carolleeae TaxID=1294199 RepID=UPI000C793E6D|nr:protein canopy 4-like isoform X2 [Eurytemora carolleeae]|eukprot:XP_023337433.1 protein canopy 4-like isoform X2 [Eurytemora affinis]
MFYVWSVLGFLHLVSFVRGDKFEEEKYGVKFASECEVCKVFTEEFSAKLEESSKKHEYVKSELRLIETLEGICDRVLQYNIHKERSDSTRFAKGQSETFRTLEGLVSKGVKVDIGIPHELWDKPSAEITQLKTQCESLLENHEEDIEDWYFNNQVILF